MRLLKISGRTGGAAPISRVVAFWVYTDEHGAPLYKVERLEDGTLGANGKPKKTFRQSKADGLGGWLPGMDGVRRAFAAIDEDDGAVWLRRHLDYCTAPLLGEPWILDVDSTVKPLYGHQEGAKVGYNPRKPGRPSHSYHTYMLANLRLVLRVDVLPGDEHNVRHATEGLWDLVDHLGSGSPSGVTPRR